MLTVNSLSGGKTSSYLAANYPADLNVFALVCIDNSNANAQVRFKPDKKMVQMVNDRLQKYCPHWPEFSATPEDPIIIKTMLDLEQHIGREIIWLRGICFSKLMNKKKAVPNIAKRFCTTEMKMRPIFEFLYKYHELPVKMRMGYRYDEMERSVDMNDYFKTSLYCERDRQLHRWQDVLWRIGEFPLIEDKITHFNIRQYWSDKNIEFPLDSNCQNCFWKDPQQLRKNYDTNPSIMKWAAVMEACLGHTLRKENSLLEIKNMGIQLDFNFGTGSGCQAGFCTD